MTGLVLILSGAVTTAAVSVAGIRRVLTREMQWLMFAAWLAIGAGVTLLCGL